MPQPPPCPPAAAVAAVTAEEGGGRLDSLLAGALAAAGLSRSSLKTLIKAGGVIQAQTRRTIKDASYRVKPGECFHVHLASSPAADRPVATDIPLHILHEDAHLAILDKPAGLVVHPAPGHKDDTLVNALAARWGGLPGPGERSGIVHRLDRDTSGLMVVARTPGAEEALRARFAAHGRNGLLDRRYTAFVWGEPRPAAGILDAPIGRHKRQRLKMAVRNDGRHARTRYRITARYGPRRTGPDAAATVCRLEFRLETGRTHQVRVHAAHAGHPLLGDALYGAGFATRRTHLSPAVRAALHALDRQALHAHLLAFTHPVSGAALSFTSPLPAALRHLEEALEA